MGNSKREITQRSSEALWLEEFQSDSFSRECIDQQCSPRELEETVEFDSSFKTAKQTRKLRDKRWKQIFDQCSYKNCIANNTLTCKNYYNTYFCKCKSGFRGWNCEVFTGVNARNDYKFNTSARV